MDKRQTGTQMKKGHEWEFCWSERREREKEQRADPHGQTAWKGEGLDLNGKIARQLLPSHGWSLGQGFKAVMQSLLPSPFGPRAPL